MNNKALLFPIRQHQYLFVLAILSFSCLAGAVPTHNILQVKYTLSIDPYFKKRDEYFVELLKLAVQKSNVQINLLPIEMDDQVESRDVINLNKGVVDINWLHTSNVLEAQLIPVRIPIDKGLFGWRVILLDKSNKNLLENVKEAPDLKKYTFLQGYDWPDTAILIANGFKIETSNTFRSFFRMLQRKRGDLFPRSMLEVWGELEDQRNMGIVADPYILLYYPTAYYFFVAKNNQPLHDAIEYGLNRAVEDGSFELLFQQYFGGVIKKTKLEDRRIITLNNPMLPLETPLQKKELWISPENIHPSQ